MFIRALFAFLALPAVAAGLIPWLLLPSDAWRTSGTPFGWPVLVIGLSILFWCVRDFYVIGKGTLAPWDPPRKLVVVGLYRFVRNPMYVGVLGSVAGWSLLAGSPLLGAYTAALAAAFHLRVMFYEEPTLARLFGSEWMQYRTTVPSLVAETSATPARRSVIYHDLTAARSGGFCHLVSDCAWHFQI